MNLIKPMLLSYQDEVTSDPNCLYEPKFDGFRLLLENDRSYTRHGTITTSKLPELFFEGDGTLLDGELIAPGTEAPDNFAGAMSRFGGNRAQPISYMAFDILYYKDEPVTQWPIENRRELLQEVVTGIDSPHINLVPQVRGEGEQLFEVMKESKMEGIVSKELGSLYFPGTRSQKWRKIINWSYHDCVVSKITFKPLTVQFQSLDGEYIGSTTIGFTKDLRVQLVMMQPPFAVKVKARGWTSNGMLRLPQIIEII